MFLLQGDVIRTKSTETLPFPLILSGTVVTFLWLLYGIIIKNPFIQVSHLYAFLSCHKKRKSVLFTGGWDRIVSVVTCNGLDGLRFDPWGG